MADLVRIDIHELLSGALLAEHGARARQIMNEVVDEAEHAGADWAHDKILDIYHADFRRPTGYYESHVYARNTSTGLEIGDGGYAGPVYGPWLEGVGSRNVTTRFRGYHAFRIVTSMLERKFADIAEHILERRTRDF